MPSFSDSQLHLAAKLYYVDGLSQKEVAKYVSVSQAHVSRLLALAQERGIVRIFVDEYEPRNTKLEKLLKQRFALSEAFVIKTHQGAPPESLRLMVARFSAPLVTSVIESSTQIAISGGRTLRHVVEQLLFPAPSRVNAILQAMGSVDSTVTPVDAQELGRLLAAQCQSTFHALNSPAYLADRESRDSFLKLDQIARMVKRFDEADAALIGIGTMEDSVFLDHGVLSSKEINALKKAGAVGEICGRFFDEKGIECPSIWSDRVVGITLKQLARIPNVVSIVSGPNRTAALTAALKGRLINSLAIDDTGAKALLE